MTQYQDWPFQNKTEANIFPQMHCHYPLARKMDQAVHPQHIQMYLDCQSKKVIQLKEQVLFNTTKYNVGFL
ncbi:hypothetical protein T4A_4246 [Trichinella pseudospiralis]|uniref:Uncharacterized protein n=1 Tax=Trichinella pseudospiralis TaxID=6337 RepID=A0A0V1DKN1_TRIPS|nr:hypothetical protein T4A_4246 [Trichinella pseudospiralis]